MISSALEWARPELLILSVVLAVLVVHILYVGRTGKLTGPGHGPPRTGAGCAWARWCLRRAGAIVSGLVAAYVATRVPWVSDLPTLLGTRRTETFRCGRPPTTCSRCRSTARSPQRGSPIRSRRAGSDSAATKRIADAAPASDRRRRGGLFDLARVRRAACGDSLSLLAGRGGARKRGCEVAGIPLPRGGAQFFLSYLIPADASCRHGHRGSSGAVGYVNPDMPKGRNRRDAICAF